MCIRIWGKLVGVGPPSFFLPRAFPWLKLSFILCLCNFINMIYDVFYSCTIYMRVRLYICIHVSLIKWPKDYIIGCKVVPLAVNGTFSVQRKQKVQDCCLV